MYNMQLNNSKTKVLRGLKSQRIHYAASSGRHPLLACTTTSPLASFYSRVFSVSTTHRAQDFSVKLKGGQTARSPLGLFINNEFVPSASGATFPLIDPRTESPLCHVAKAAKEDVDKAVHASNLALYQNNQWRDMSQRERGNMLYRLAELVEENAEELALLESLNSGVSLGETKGFHIPFTVNCLRYYAGWADKLSGKTIPFPGRYLCYTKREPVGVVGGIIPWNFPLMLLSWKFGPAMAAGNALIVKPSELTPLTALRFAELTREAGFPDGVFQVVPGYGKEAGDALARHMKVDKVAFTGSTDTGRLIMKAAAESNLKRVSMELGGKSPNIIFSDVDLEQAVKWAHMGVFLNGGQNCCAGSRVFVQEKVYDEFLERSKEAANKRIVGDPLDPSTEQGPCVDKNQYEKVMKYIQYGKEEGATLVSGGGRPQEMSDKGYFVRPTIFADVSENMKIAREEIFGPIMSVMKFKDEEEVIQRANDTEFGLAAAVFTNDISRALSIANNVRAGTVWVNSYNWTDPAAPFGGIKGSGFGRDLSEYAFEQYTEIKTVTINYDPKNQTL